MFTSKKKQSILPVDSQAGLPGCPWVCAHHGGVGTCSHRPRWPRVSEQTDRANVSVHHHVPSSMMPATLQVLDKHGFNKLHVYCTPLGAQVHGDFFAAWGSPAQECSSIIWLRWNMKSLTKPWPLKTQPGCSLSPAWPVPSGLLAPSGDVPSFKDLLPASTPTQVQEVLLYKPSLITRHLPMFPEQFVSLVYRHLSFLVICLYSPMCVVFFLQLGPLVHWVQDWFPPPSGPLTCPRTGTCGLCQCSTNICFESPLVPEGHSHNTLSYSYCKWPYFCQCFNFKKI